MSSDPFKSRDLLSVRDVFDKVTRLVRETKESVDLSVNQVTKLRLYGLYKHVTCGPSSSSGCQQPPIYHPLERAKYNAWYACHGFSKEEAMWKYIRTVSSTGDFMAIECRTLLQQCCVTQQDNDSVGKETVKYANEPRYEPLTSLDNQRDPSISDFGSDDIWEPPAKKKLPWLQEWCRVVTPIVPRGKLDIGTSDSLYAACQCIFRCCQTSTSCRYHQLDQRIKKIVTMALKQPSWVANNNTGFRSSPNNYATLILLHSSIPTT